jgi:hypothetical protein
LKFLPDYKNIPQVDPAADQQRPDCRCRHYPYAAYLYEAPQYALPEGCEVRGRGNNLQPRDGHCVVASKKASSQEIP